MQARHSHQFRHQFFHRLIPSQRRRLPPAGHIHFRTLISLSLELAQSTIRSAHSLHHRQPVQTPLTLYRLSSILPICLLSMIIMAQATTPQLNYSGVNHSMHLRKYLWTIPSMMITSISTSIPIMRTATMLVDSFPAYPSSRLMVLNPKQKKISWPVTMLRLVEDHLYSTGTS